MAPIIGDTGQTTGKVGTGLEGYDATGSENQRQAISGMGSNQYFTAAQNMSPAGYQANPNNTASFSAPPGPGVAPAGGGMTAPAGAGVGWNGQNRALTSAAGSMPNAFRKAQ